jgi:hypothetical protein
LLIDALDRLPGRWANPVLPPRWKRRARTSVEDLNRGANLRALRATAGRYLNGLNSRRLG